MESSHVSKYVKYKTKNLISESKGVINEVNYFCVWLGSSMKENCDDKVNHCIDKLISNVKMGCETSEIDQFNCYILCDSDDFFEQVNQKFAIMNLRCNLIKCNIKERSFIEKINRNLEYLLNLPNNNPCILCDKIYQQVDQQQECCDNSSIIQKIAELYNYCTKYLNVPNAYRAHISDIIRILGFVYIFEENDLSKNTYYVYLDTDDKFRQGFFQNLVLSRFVNISIGKNNNNVIICDNNTIMYIPHLCNLVFYRLIKSKNYLHKLYEKDLKLNMENYFNSFYEFIDLRDKKDKKNKTDKINFRGLSYFILYFISEIAGPKSYMAFSSVNSSLKIDEVSAGSELTDDPKSFFIWLYYIIFYFSYFNRGNFYNFIMELIDFLKNANFMDEDTCNSLKNPTIRDDILSDEKYTLSYVIDAMQLYIDFYLEGKYTITLNKDEIYAIWVNCQ
jgi:hypothetical protein